MPVNQNGLLIGDDPSKSTQSSGSGTAGGNAPGQQGQQNAFGPVTPGQIQTTGAAVAAPSVQQFAFNPKYAAQSQGLDQLLADKQQQRQNDLFAAQQSYDRNVADA